MLASVFGPDLGEGCPSGASGGRDLDGSVRSAARRSAGEAMFSHDNIHKPKGQPTQIRESYPTHKTTVKTSVHVYA